MGQVTLGEQAAPSTPTAGVILWPTIATPSIPKWTDDAGVTYSLAGLEKQQTFTKQQTITPDSTGVHGILINMPTSTTGDAIRTTYNSTIAYELFTDASTTLFFLAARNLGNNVAGPRAFVDRNTNGGAEGPAAGCHGMRSAGNTAYYIWPDASGNLRIHTAQPTGSSGSPTVSDTAGTVVGTQTSMAEAKLISDDLSVLGDVMARIRQGAQAVRRFTYRSGAFNNQEFEGVVTNYAPAYGMDRDADHPAGKSLNVIQAIGDLLRTIDWLVNRVQELEAKLA